MSGESKIDTKLFMTTAENITTRFKSFSSALQEWFDAMARLRNNWQGDTSDDIKNTVDAVFTSASDLEKSLKGYPAALLELAGIYDKTEKNVQETGKSLTFDKAMR